MSARPTTSQLRATTGSPARSSKGQPGGPQGAMNNPAAAELPGQPQGAAHAAGQLQQLRLRRRSGSPIVSFDPPTLDQAVGSTFTVNVNLAGGQNVSSVPLQIMYNPRVLAAAECVQRNPAGARRSDGRAGQPRRQHGGHSSGDGLAASGNAGHLRRWLGLYPDLPGAELRDSPR